MSQEQHGAIEWGMQVQNEAKTEIARYYYAKEIFY
jgi:hypothetical protein